MKHSDLEMSAEQVNEAVEMHKECGSWDRVAAFFGMRRHTMMDIIHPERKIKKQLSDKNYKAKTKANRENYAVGHRVKAATYFDKAPAEILEERERREAIKYESYTAEFFGDPKPGYSALDKKRGF